MILKKKESHFKDFDDQSYVKIEKLLDLKIKDEYKDELKELYSLEDNIEEILKIGNSTMLIDALIELDDACKKIDLKSKIRNVQLKRLYEKEKAVFEIFEIEDEEILLENGSDILEVETAYSAKNDILDYYSLSKFANYCRDLEYDQLVGIIKDYLKVQNENNETERGLRLVYNNEDKKYFFRALTSADGYKDYGINFSIVVALLALDSYAEDNDEEIFINSFVVDESTIYVSFQLTKGIILTPNLSLKFTLILENDEIKRNAVSFNGVFTLIFNDNGKESEIFLKPKGMKSDESDFPSDLLTYRHSGSITNVLEKIGKLPELIKEYVQQVSEDAKNIVEIKHPDDVRKLIARKIKYSKKPEFKAYKDQIFKSLMNNNVNNVFGLFELLRSVDDLFEHTDVISKDFWRSKIYEALVNKN